MATGIGTFILMAQGPSNNPVRGKKTAGIYVKAVVFIINTHVASGSDGLVIPIMTAVTPRSQIVLAQGTNIFLHLKIAALPHLPV